MRTSTLAIFTPQIGSLSETFIRQHIQDLWPGRTVVITGTSDKPHGGHWTLDCPMLVLDQPRPGFFQRACRAIRREFNGPDERKLDLAAVSRFLKQHHVDLFMGEYLDLALPYLEAVQESGIRFFAHAHGYDVSERLASPAWREAYRRYNESDGVITMSQFSRKRLLELGLETSKVHVVPYGIKIPPQRSSRVSDDTVRCLAVGRMAAMKAPLITLDAFRRMLNGKHVRLDMIGAGELFGAAQHFVQRFELYDEVWLHGGQAHETVLQYLQQADIFLQHSLTDLETGAQEGLPVAILEAMAYGVPVISTRHAGIPEAVIDGVCGYLVEEGDVQGMADRLHELVHNPDLRQKMGQAGRQRAGELFCWEKERNDMLQILGLAPELLRT
ncbi:hypothetical protein CSB45_06325 [candidate division KSB3 bacterium]|uniref:Uncharacterized protein n=1 Tax=candidate division KSB3 bacterium TaxID=2044937 RepID=A0A2G6E6W7_9BACT|nr:MAG: hypothetical protein CSB45_06325 [candidate division KSB3 bacterium]PIE30259.1 MAG: hypothetical protein CSA57_05040 [candidate division KSB3 bacterium]